MLNFSIMTLDEEHIDAYCEDIAYQVKNGIATMPLFMMPLTPKAIPPLAIPSRESHPARLGRISPPTSLAPSAAWIRTHSRSRHNQKN